MAAPARFEKERRNTVESVEAALAQAGVHHDDRVLAAVSGGSDSTALVEILVNLPLSRRPALSLAYVDHGLEPDRHRREAEHVAALARRCRLDFACLRLDNAGHRDEAALRAMRHGALEDHAAQSACRWIATGHTLDDQIETVLFRLLRGSGRLGIGGIALRRGMWIRPLLAIRRRELQRILTRVGLTWCEDPSNADPRYARNRIRGGLVPVIEAEIGRRGLARLGRASQRWREEDRLLEELAAREYAYAVRGEAVDVVALRGSAPPLRARVLRRWLRETGLSGSVELVHVEAVEALALSARETGRIDLPGLTVNRGDGRLTGAQRKLQPPAACPAAAKQVP